MVGHCCAISLSLQPEVSCSIDRKRQSIGRLHGVATIAQIIENPLVLIKQVFKGLPVNASLATQAAIGNDACPKPVPRLRQSQQRSGFDVGITINFKSGHVCLLV